MSFLHLLQGCQGRADGCGCSAGHDVYAGLSEAAASLLRASAVEGSEPVTREEWITKGPRVAVLCPAGTTFDAAEALRLELVARAPAGVVVDVQIAPAVPGALSAEHEAGVQLFGELRAERLAGCGCTSPDPGECSVCSPEHEQYCNGYACAGCNPPPRCACHVASKPLPADDEPFPWDEPEGGAS